MRILSLLLLGFLLACNGVKQEASVESGGQTSSGELPISHLLSTITVSSSSVNLGFMVLVTVSVMDRDGKPFVSPTPLQVLFYTNGGESRGTFSSVWNNGDGSYSSFFTGTASGSATKIRALVNFADVQTTYPTVTVLAPALEWSPGGEDFGFVPQGTTGNSTEFVLRNNGNTAATGCSPPVLSDTTNFIVVSDTCGSSDLAAGANCTFEIQSRPMSLGLKRANLSRSCANGGTSSTFPLRIRVTGVDPAALSWSPLTQDFGSVGVGDSSSSQTFTFTNSGTGRALGCDYPVLSDTQNFKIVSDTCLLTNQYPAQSCTVSVQATPKSTGTKTATLSRSCLSGGTAGTTTNGLSYLALEPVTLNWSPLSRNFGSIPEGQVGGSSVFTLTNSNTGTATGCSAPTLTNATDFEISFDGCGTSDLGPGATCQIFIKPRPQTAGTFTATLSRTCSFGGTPTTTTDAITVTAPAADATLSWFRNDYKLGEISPGKESNIITLPLRNTGNIAATGCSAPTLSDGVNFTIVSDGCGTGDLSAGDHCLVSVKANPAAPATVTSTLDRICTTGGTASTNLAAEMKSSSVLTLADGGGSNHTCLVMSDNTVKCWGLNYSGQLGNGAAPSENAGIPKEAVTISNALSLSSSNDHTCALLSDGTVSCWGFNNSGQLGDGTINNQFSPTPVPTLTNVIQVAAGDSHSCALLNTGSVQCWGLNSSGQLGNGTTSASLSPVDVTGITNAIGITAGGEHTCATLSTNAISCWGKNSSGQLGDGTTVNKTTPVPVSGISDALSVVAGKNFTCSIRNGGVTLSCWGENTKGQIGDGTLTNRTTAVDVTLGANVTQVDGGKDHACALLADNTVKCWGASDSNQVGDNGYTDRPSPVSVFGITTATELTVGSRHACALLGDGSVRCWGDNSLAALLGAADTDYSYSPNLLTTIPNITDVAQGINFNCALDSSGTVYCWGGNDRGQLGDGTTTAHRLPAAVPGITTAVEIEAGEDHACALLADSSVTCWGSNDNGAFGNGNTSSSTTPVATGLTGVTSLKLGRDGGCGLIDDGTVRCWGRNGGDVGNGTTSQTLTPATVTGITTATAIVKGYSHSCALLADKTVRCWGVNKFGSLGDGTNFIASTPVTVRNLTEVQSISSHGDTTCAVITDGSLRCWGLNTSSQAGDGTTTNRNTPVTVNISDVISVSAGTNFTCAVKTGGQVQCFGNYLGISQTSPVPVFGLQNISTMNVFESPCAINITGDLFCWGINTLNKTNADVHSIRTVNGF